LFAVAVIFGAALAAASAAPIQSYVEARGPAGPLKGTMLAPASLGASMMLIIPGSGPTDRDGNNPYGLKASSYKLLAEGLAARGIGTVRIDKRGMFASTPAVTDANAVTIDDYVTDVGAWTTSIRTQTNAPCVWLLGHSEGGLVALAAAQKVQDICGLVLISTAGRPLGEVLRTQLRSNPANAPILDQAMSAIDTLEAGKRFDVTRMNPALLPLFAPQVQGFLINVFS
jgi:pimeloyl-ACP methyl ester carboxylesterase